MTQDLLTQPTWDHLDARLRDAVARDPNNARLVEAIRAPVVTLQLLWRDAIPTLTGDPIAAERLRVTLRVAAPAAALVPVAAAALAKHGNTEASQAGLVHLRKLLVIALACYRIQSPAQAAFSREVIKGLAFQCGPAEMLARLEPHGASADAYDHLLRLTVPAMVAAGIGSRLFLRGQALDPIERARWHCIFELLPSLLEKPSELLDARPAERMAVKAAVSQTPWTIAHADGIDGVHRIGDRLRIEGSFPWLDGAFPADRLAVVGVSAAQTAELGTDVKVEDGGLSVSFATDVLWVGFVDRERVDAVNKLRLALREALGAEAQIDCTAGEPELDGEALLPALDPEAWPIAEVPPRTSANQVPPGRAEVEQITVVALCVATVEGQQAVLRAEVVKRLNAIGQGLGVRLDAGQPAMGGGRSGGAVVGAGHQ